MPRFYVTPVIIVDAKNAQAAVDRVNLTNLLDFAGDPIIEVFRDDGGDAVPVDGWAVLPPGAAPAPVSAVPAELALAEYLAACAALGCHPGPSVDEHPRWVEYRRAAMRVAVEAYLESLTAADLGRAAEVMVSTEISVDATAIERDHARFAAIRAAFRAAISGGK